MPELRGFSGQQAVNILIKMGFIVSRKAKGSHVILKRGELVCVVPMHIELAVWTLRNALRQAKISPEEFLKNS